MKPMTITVRNKTTLLEDMLNKAKIMGCNITRIKTTSDKIVYAMQESANDALILIPDDVETLKGAYLNSTLDGWIQSLHGNIKLVGGHNLKTLSNAFALCTLQKLDLSLLDTKHVTNMSAMFSNFKAERLMLNDINTESVDNMTYMFDGCVVPEIDLSSFNTKNVTNMYGMFYRCKADKLNITSFEGHAKVDTRHMFYKSVIKEIEYDESNTFYYFYE